MPAQNEREGGRRGPAIHITRRGLITGGAAAAAALRVEGANAFPFMQSHKDEGKFVPWAIGEGVPPIEGPEARPNGWYGELTAAMVENASIPYPGPDRPDLAQKKFSPNGEIPVERFKWRPESFHPHEEHPYDGIWEVVDDPKSGAKLITPSDATTVLVIKSRDGQLWNAVAQGQGAPVVYGDIAEFWPCATTIHAQIKAKKREDWLRSAGKNPVVHAVGFTR